MLVRKSTALFWRYLGVATLGMGGMYYAIKIFKEGKPLPATEVLLTGVALLAGALLLGLGALALGRIFYLMDRRNP